MGMQVRLGPQEVEVVRKAWELRQEDGRRVWTLDKLARKCGVSITTIWNVVKGRGIYAPGRREEHAAKS